MHIDRNGISLVVGDWVLFEEAPEVLLRDLPPEDQAEIKLQANVPMQVVAFDDYGFAEMEFIGKNGGTFHTIWVEPKYIIKVNASD